MLTSIQLLLIFFINFSASSRLPKVNMRTCNVSSFSKCGQLFITSLLIVNLLQWSKLLLTFHTGVLIVMKIHKCIPMQLLHLQHKNCSTSLGRNNHGQRFHEEWCKVSFSCILVLASFHVHIHDFKCVWYCFLHLRF